GEHVEVGVMVQPGHSPVTYEPTPRQMAALSVADAYIRIGVPFESFWMKHIREANPDLEIIDARAGVDSSLRPEGYEKDSVRRDEDPHIWLDPTLAAEIAKTIRNYLIRTDEANSDDYRRNTEQLLDELEQLDTHIRNIFSPVSTRRFLVFHPAWGYFAEAYGLEQLVVEHEGKEPGPHALSRLVELARRKNIRTVFVQKQISSQMANTLATEIDGRVVVLDPLAADYFGNLMKVARAIADANLTPIHGSVNQFSGPPISGLK
ncbi:unnamed protein product, partial [marine sediment metagenome]